MIKSPLRFLLYIFLRNDISWSMLSKKERQLIKDENSKYNVLRDDYFNIEKFGISRQKDGERWDTYNFELLLENKVKGEDAKYLFNKLQKYQPKDVLEIGSGPGLFSRMLFEFNSVDSLTVNDINPQFIEYLNLLAKKESVSNKKFEGLLGNLVDIKIEKKFDMIVIISSLHHIPDRLLLFRKLEVLLKEKGVIVVCEPSYYLKRIYHLLKKIPMFIDGNYMNNISNYSTHHHCTKGEYKSILNQCRYLNIVDIDFNTIGKNRPFFRFFNYSIFKKYLSHRIFITFQKNLFDC